MAAAILLLEARSEIFPDYDPFARTPQAKSLMALWHDWLASHEIDERTARRLIYEHHNPEARIARVEADRQAHASRRAEDRGQTSDRHHQAAPEAPPQAPQQPTPAPAPESPAVNRTSARKSNVVDMRIRQAATGLSQGQIELVLDFINELKKADE